MKDEVDILREVGTISAGHGSMALSEILGTRICLKMPSVNIVSVKNMSEQAASENMMICVNSHLHGDLKGNIVFLLDGKSAFKLIDLCYKICPDEKKKGILTEMGLSLIKEVGNMVIASYIGALAMMLKIIVMPSVPVLVSGPYKQIMNLIVSPFSDENYILSIEVMFEEPHQNITGSFYLILNPEAMDFVQNSCKKLLESL